MILNDDGHVFVDGVGHFRGALMKKTTHLYRRDDVGFLSSNYNLVPNLTAKENVELAAEIGKDAQDAEEA